jgi:hypothetical protein
MRFRTEGPSAELIGPRCESGEAYENMSYALEAARRFGPRDREIEVEE